MTERESLQLGVIDMLFSEVEAAREILAEVAAGQAGSTRDKAAALLERIRKHRERAKTT